MQAPIQQTNHSAPPGLLLSLLPYAIACVVLSALPLFTHAQDAPPGTPPAYKHISNPAMPDVAPPPHPMGMMMRPPSLAHLDLTDEQQDKVFQLIHGLSRTMYENEKIAHKTIQEIRQLAQSDHFDANKARSLAEAHGRALTDIAYLNTVIQAQTWAMLTPDQRRRLSSQLDLLSHKQ
jgi:Spy/CpxP family protein refolding chaperone